MRLVQIDSLQVLSLESIINSNLHFTLIQEKTDKNSTRQDHSPVYGKHDSHSHASSFNMGYLVSPYSYANGAAGALPVSMVSHITTKNIKIKRGPINLMSTT